MGFFNDHMFAGFIHRAYVSSIQHRSRDNERKSIETEAEAETIVDLVRDPHLHQPGVFDFCLGYWFWSISGVAAAVADRKIRSSDQRLDFVVDGHEKSRISTKLVLLLLSAPLIPGKRGVGADVAVFDRRRM